MHPVRLPADRGPARGLEPAYEQAAADLYAGPLAIFRRVTLPLMAPGIVAGFMLAFIISLDDFIITNMVAGPGATTLPVLIYGMVRTGFSPEINAVSTLLLATSILFVSLSFAIGGRRR
ncbi:MAG TPA: ABC transporter permease subunit [Geminicoccaceae bacterium]